MTLEDYLYKNALLFPEKKAIVCGNDCLSYAELCNKVDERAKILANADRLILLEASSSIDFLVEYFAIHKSGKVAVPLAKNLPQSSKAEIMRLCQNADIPDGVADVLFTTGTTGASKGVMVSNDAIIADAENLVDAQGYHQGITFVINGPLNHIGSLSKVYPTIMVGGTISIVDGMKDLNNFFAAIESAKSKVATFLVPTSIRLLLNFARQKLIETGDKIEFIETGAAPISLSDMRQLCSVLPNTRLFNTYASTETGIIATFNYNKGECLSGCLGKPMRHSQIMITDEGKIACSGKTLMSGYLSDDELTRKVLLEDCVVTSDLGFLDEQGRLHLTGRIGDVINIGGYKVAPIEIEELALSLPFVSDCICIAENHRVFGKILVLLIVPANDCEFNRKLLAKHLQSHLEPYKVPQQIRLVDSVRRTYNGKLDRKSYTAEL